jgi:hypothetical protein
MRLQTPQVASATLRQGLCRIMRPEGVDMTIRGDRAGRAEAGISAAAAIPAALASTLLLGGLLLIRP